MVILRKFRRLGEWCTVYFFVFKHRGSNIQTMSPGFLFDSAYSQMSANIGGPDDNVQSEEYGWG